MKKHLILLVAILSFCHTSIAQIDEQRFTEPDRFGNNVAISGNWAIIGNFMETYTANGGTEYNWAGSASIFRKQANGIWILHTKLREMCWYPGGSQSGNYFGHSVSIDGGWAVVGSKYDSDNLGDIGPDGIVFLYRYDDDLNAWVLHQQLSGPVHSFHFFGYAVSIKDNLLAIGDPYCTTNGAGGRVYTYRYSPDSGFWEAESSLVASDGDDSHEFGHAISVSSGHVLVGAPKKGANQQGGAYLYQYDEGIYTQTMLHQPSAADLDQFGYSTAIHSDYLIIGSPGTNGSANASGKAYVYERNANNGQWNLIQTLVPADNEAGDGFGHAVATGTRNEEVLFTATAPFWDGLMNNETNRGVAYIYRLNTNTQEWSNNMLISSDGASDHKYGIAAGMDRSSTCGSMAVSAVTIETTPQGVSYGAAYIYSLLPSSLGIWTGADDNDWYNPANWSDNLVPNGATDVSISDGLTNYPQIDGLAFCRNLTIEAGASVELIDSATELRISGDLLALGSFLFVDEASMHSPQLYVEGDASFYCNIDKWLPGGVYNEKVYVNASNLHNRLYLAGDVTILGQLHFEHATMGQVHIGARTLVLHNLIGGLNTNGLHTNRFSNLVLTGNPPIACNLSRNINEINNLTINNDEGVQWITANSLSIFGVLTLLNGEFNVVGNNGNAATVTLYHSVAGNSSLFNTSSGHFGANLIIMSDEEDYQLPAGMTTIEWLLVSNPSTISLNNNLMVNEYMFIIDGQLNTNGYALSYGPEGQFWSVSNTEISESMIDADNPPSKVWVRGNQLLFNANADIGELQVDAISQGFKLAAGRQLTVGSTDKVNQKLFLSSSQAGNASFIDLTASKNNLEAEVEQHLTCGKWHYVSPPVTGAKAAAYYFENASPSWLKYFDETNDNWVFINSLEENLIPGMGYAVWVDNDKADETAVLDGILMRADILVNLSYSGPQKGWNLVGNPFTSALDWDAAGWNLQNTSGIAYVWNDGNYLSRNQIGQGTLPDGIIPSGQGFFVQSTAPAASMLLPLNARVHHSQTMFKDTKRNFANALEITANIKGKTDKTWLGFNEAGTSEIDTGLDAFRLEGAADMPKLYSRHGDINLSINILESLSGEKLVPLYFESPLEGQVELSFQFVESFDQTTILLADLLTGQQVELTANNNLIFNTRPGDPEHRFNLLFNRHASSEQTIEKENDYHLIHANGILQLTHKSGHDVSALIQVWDASGRLLLRKEGIPAGQLSINTSQWPSGIIALSINENNKVQYYKVIIQ